VLGEFSLSPTPATNPIKDVIVFSKPLASISDVKVCMDVASAPNAVVYSNSLRLQQVLINLVSNAIKYTAKGTKVIVSTYESTVSDVHTTIDSALVSSRNSSDRSACEDSIENQAVLVFSVSDCGPGIEPDQAHRLFQRFAQLDNQSSRSSGSRKIGQPSGTGLGLHLCQLFVQRMSGHIWVTNNKREKKGSTFSFSLPLFSNESSPEDNHVPDAIITQEFKKGISGARNIPKSVSDNSLSIKDDMRLVYERRILLVDDTLINRKVLSRILVKVGFLNVTTVESGEAAMEELLKEKNYDIVISDLQMPGMSGTELSRAIATVTATSVDRGLRRPVVVGLTADTSPGVTKRCQSSKMSDVLYKPVTIGELKKYAETVIPSLHPGVWYDGNVEDEGYSFRTATFLPVQ
jgi:CheY-like chemotaxis protein